MSAIVSTVYAQDEIEDIREEIGELQSQIDSLNALLNELIQEASVINSPQMQLGVAGPMGSLLDKEYFYINHNDDWKIPYWVAHFYLTKTTFRIFICFSTLNL